MTYGGFAANNSTLCEGDSEGEIEATLERARDLDVGELGPSKWVPLSPILLSGSGGYTVPFVSFDRPENGDQGR